jgi:hypothetical protein
LSFRFVTEYSSDLIFGSLHFSATLTYSYEGAKNNRRKEGNILSNKMHQSAQQKAIDQKCISYHFALLKKLINDTFVKTLTPKLLTIIRRKARQFQEMWAVLKTTEILSTTVEKYGKNKHKRISKTKQSAAHPKILQSAGRDLRSLRNLLAILHSSRILIGRSIDRSPHGFSLEKSLSNDEILGGTWSGEKSH